jgi:putative membrane protein
VEVFLTMLLFHHGDRVFGGHGWWWALFGGLLPALLLIGLIGVAVWAVLRLTGGGPGAIRGWAAPAMPRPDGVLEEVRLRYARGEIGREEFLQRMTDLGATGPGETPPRPAG